MRLLLVIGCDDHVDKRLKPTSAEIDARNVFEALIKPEIGDYDLDRSKVLYSPTLDEVRVAFRDMLTSAQAIDTFTFYFAGHGLVKSNGYFMFMRDTTLGMESFEALPLSEIFRYLGGIHPSQSNIIIDACESGGLVEDLAGIVKSSLMGDASSMGLTIFVTAGMDQYANALQQGGIGTTAMLDCIHGHTYIHDTSSALTLEEVGRKVSTGPLGENQNSAVWGFNLSGAPSFCRNPHYGVDPGKPFREVIQAWPKEYEQLVQDNYDRLWSAYSSIDTSWNAREFADTIDIILSKMTTSGPAFVTFAMRLGLTCLQRAGSSHDPFRPVEVGAAIYVAVLPYIEQLSLNSLADHYLALITQHLEKACNQLLDDMENDKFAMLNNGGLSNLYTLPIRLSKVLGWAASLRWLDQKISSRLPALLRAFIDQYTLSLTVISESQAPFLAVAFKEIKRQNLTEDGETLFGCLFNSLCACRGLVTRTELPADKWPTYLRLRAQNAHDGIREFAKRPSETLAVMLRAAHELDLAEVIDPSLVILDREFLMMYVSSEYEKFGARTMEGGHNLEWMLGNEVFCTADFISHWPKIDQPRNHYTATGAILASFLYPDRTPWFVVEAG